MTTDEVQIYSGFIDFEEMVLISENNGNCISGFLYTDKYDF